MEDVKKTLIVCFRQDLDELDSVASKIRLHVTNFELNSWLFPTKGCFEVPKSEDESYVNCLEFLLDRLYLCVGLVVKFIEGILDFGTTTSPKNVVVPKNLTFGRMLRVLSDRLFSLKDLLKTDNNNITSHSRRITKNGEVQTDENALQQCDSCFLAVGCIKHTLRTLNVDNLNKNIYEITQVGCMWQATNLIGGSIKSFLQKIGVLESNNKQLKRDIKECTASMTTKTELIIMQEDKIRVLNKLFDKERNKFESVRKLNNELTQKCLKNVEDINLLRMEVAEMKSSNLEYAKFVEEKSIEAARLGNCLQNVSLHLDVLLAQNFSIRTHLSDVTNQKGALEDETKNLQNKCFNQTKIIDQMCSRFEDFDTKIDSLFRNFEKNEEVQKELEHAIITVANNKKHKMDKMVSTHDLVSETHAFSIIKGDPLKDMIEQVEVNVIQIRFLQQQNDSLLETIRKLRKVQQEATNNKAAVENATTQ